MSDLLNLAEFVASECLHLAPWFLFAIVLGVAVQKLSIDVLARRSFRRRGVTGIVVVTAIGAFSPFCSFTVIPLIRRFLIAGVPLSAVMTFWVASPSMDPEIYALSASQLGFPIATGRLVGALILSFGAGVLVLMLERRGYFAHPLRGAEQVKAEAETSCSSAPATAVTSRSQTDANQAPVAVTTLEREPQPASSSCSGAQPEQSSCSSSPSGTDFVDDGTPWLTLARRDLRELRAKDVLKDIATDTWQLGRWLLLAIVLEGLVVMYVPDTIVENILGVDGLVSIVVAGLISVPLYLNGVGAIPVVNGLLEQGMLPAAAVTFLLGGAVTTIPAMVAVRSVVNTKVFLVYLGVGLIGSVSIGLALLPLL